MNNKLEMKYLKIKMEFSIAYFIFLLFFY
jgi:hypothetical protein